MINNKIKLNFFFNKKYNYNIYILYFYKYFFINNKTTNIINNLLSNNTTEITTSKLEDIYNLELEDYAHGIDLDIHFFINIIRYIKLNFFKFEVFKFFNNLGFFYNLSLYQLDNGIVVGFKDRRPWPVSLKHYILTNTSSIFMINYSLIDHIRYFNIKVKKYSTLNELNFYNLLDQRYGIGKTISKLLLNYLGISYNYLMKYLPINEFYTKLNLFFSSRLLKLDHHLLGFFLSRHSFLKKIKAYRGFRLLKGYPTNGQRTRSNHKTSLRKPYHY